MPRHYVTQHEAVQWIARNVRPQDDAQGDVLARYSTVRLVADLWSAHPNRVAERVWNERHPTFDPLVRAEWYRTLRGEAPNGKTEEGGTAATARAMEKAVPRAAKAKRARRKGAK